MKYRITHTTLYQYNDDVSLCHNEAHLIPRTLAHQTCLNYQIIVEPIPLIQQHRQDCFGNLVTYFSIESPHNRLTVTARSEVEIHPPTLITTISPSWEQVRDILSTDLAPESLSAREFTLESPFTSINAPLYNYAKVSFTPHRSLQDAVADLMQRIHTEFTYDPSFTTVVTPLEEVLRYRRGVCQDFAHLMIACLRSLGLAARYVSGYLETLPPPGQPKLQGSDASHAWLSVYVPQQGWLDFDPTNNQLPTTQHITTAWGRDYSDVTPLKGIIFGGGENTLTVAVDVDRLPTEPLH